MGLTSPLEYWLPSSILGWPSSALVVLPLADLLPRVH